MNNFRRLRPHAIDLLQIAHDIAPECIAPYSKDKPRHKISAVFDLSADTEGIRRVIRFCSILKIRSGIELKIHKLAARCIEAEFAVATNNELEYLSHFCDTPAFTQLVAQYKIKSFDFVSNARLPIYTFN